MDNLRDVFCYCPESGAITWKIEYASKKKGAPVKNVGDRADTTHGHGYLYVNYKSVTYPAQKLAWLLYFGTWPDGVIDHKNLNRADNRLDNLRFATWSQNQANKSKSKGNEWPKGVRKDGNRFCARIRHNKKYYDLGRFSTPEDAGEAYKAAALRFHGEFARW